MPPPNTDFVAAAAGYHHSLGLKSDGSIVAWGDNHYGECMVPAPNTGFVAIAAGGGHSLGLKTDGSIVGWGADYYGQSDTPASDGGFVAITAGVWHSLALRADDDDGVGYPLDNCPRLYNPDQADADADTVGDMCDACPDTAPGGWITFAGCAPGDFDLDGDVDLNDFTHFQACFNGPDRWMAERGCAGADIGKWVSPDYWEDDADVDLHDFLTFQACFNGPNQPAACF